MTATKVVTEALITAVSIGNLAVAHCNWKETTTLNRTKKVGIAVVIVGLLVAGGLWFWISGRGFSTREKPSALEAFMARRVRHLATPPDARTMTNPVVESPEALRSGMLHFADHCASCHANNGDGDTALGRGMYPPAPNMQLPDTQNLTDGELFYIIENGIRFTGMPGWGAGKPEDAEGTWELVHFIRNLSKLNDEQLEEMRKNNPRNPQEVLEEDEVRRFFEEEPTNRS